MSHLPNRSRVVAVAGMILAASVGPPGGPAASSLPQSELPHAVLAARAAIGREAIERMSSLLVTADAQEVSDRGGGRSVATSVELRFVLPDKYLRRRWPAVLPDLVMSFGFDGRSLIDRTQTPPNAFIDTRFPPPKAVLDRTRARNLLMLRRECTRLLIALLLCERTPIPVAFKDAGRAKSEDGEADVVSISGEDEFGATLFIDARTHLPLMLTFSELEGRQTTPGGATTGGSDGRSSAASGASYEMVQQRLYFAEHRRVDGIVLPHVITRTIDGKSVIEWQIRKVEVNPRDILLEFQK